MLLAYVAHIGALHIFVLAKLTYYGSQILWMPTRFLSNNYTTVPKSLLIYYYSFLMGILINRLLTKLEASQA